MEKTIELSAMRNPNQVISEATVAAKALDKLVKETNSIVLIRGQKYLRFEHWQTLGQFFGITAKVVSTNPISFDDGEKGFEAKAVALNRSGIEISAAEAMCLNTEKNWAGKDKFQLRSMAQTRACAKALRNVLAFIPTMAGYQPVAAEEVEGSQEGFPTAGGKPVVEPPKKKLSKTTQNLWDFMVTKSNGNQEQALAEFRMRTTQVLGREVDNPREITEPESQVVLDSYNVKVKEAKAVQKTI